MSAWCWCMPNAIDAGVLMHSCFAELPDCILNSCLRLTSFEAKLRCQQVCRSWRSLFNRSAASGDACDTSLSDLWGPSLNLYVSEPTERRARTQVANLQSRQAVTVVHLETTVGQLSLHNEACLQWISQRAVVFPEVHIDMTAVLPAQLMLHLAAALRAAAALAPSAWQRQLYAGERTWAAQLQWSKANNSVSLQVSSSCQVTYTPCYADFDITDPQNGCQQLAGLLTYWKAETAYIQQLCCLTLICLGLVNLSLALSEGPSATFPSADT